MSTRVTTNFAPLATIPLSSTELMREIGELALRWIRTRTEQGTDFEGRPFAGLSEGYAKQKAKAGLPPVANLTVSGRMLNDMRQEDTSESRTVLGFSSMGGSASGHTFIQRSRSVGAADKAFYHQEAGAGKSRVLRQFFDLSESEVDQLQDRVDRYLGKALEA
jgi:hypothetical protein